MNTNSTNDTYSANETRDVFVQFVPFVTFVARFLELLFHFGRNYFSAGAAMTVLRSESAASPGFAPFGFLTNFARV